MDERACSALGANGGCTSDEWESTGVFRWDDLQRGGKEILRARAQLLLMPGRLGGVSNWSIASGRQQPELYCFVLCKRVFAGGRRFGRAVCLWLAVSVWLGTGSYLSGAWNQKDEGFMGRTLAPPIEICGFIFTGHCFAGFYYDRSRRGRALVLQNALSVGNFGGRRSAAHCKCGTAAGRWLAVCLENGSTIGTARACVKAFSAFLSVSLPARRDLWFFESGCVVPL